MSRLSQGAAAVTSGGENVSHTRNQLEAAVRAKRSVEAIELIPEVKKEKKKSKSPLVGFEPTIPGLGGQCLIR